MSQRNERSMQPKLDGMPRWLIHHAARRAPQSLSARLEEEWLADLESRSSSLSKLRFAVGCCWATLVIANDYPRSRVAESSPVAAARGLITLADRNFGYFSLRSATLFLIAGLHAALFYGLITALAPVHQLATPPDLQNTVIDDPPLVPTIPTSAGTEFKDWTIHVQKPDVHVSTDIDFGDVTIDGLENSPESHSAPPPPERPAHVVQQVAGAPGAGFPETADFYPSASIRLEEQGMSTVRVCVDAKGRLTSDPTTVQGSGSTRLDAAALKLARAGSGHYRATTEDGQPVNACYPFGVRFQLKK
jgi:TonB family protein